MDLIAVHCLASLCISLTPPCDLFAPAIALLCTSNLDFQNGCCFMLLNTYVMLNIKSKLSNIIYLYISQFIELYVDAQLYCNFEESSLINIVENYNHHLAFNDNFTMMSNCTYFYLIIFISWIIKGYSY